jgi:hypothetical protein
MNSRYAGSRNIEQIMVIASAIGPLVEEVVFLGGCSAGLLVEEAARQAARATEDVDVIVDVATLRDYYAFGGRLKERGFRESTGEGALICRWFTVIAGARLILDVMPTDENILGFSNRWYVNAVKEYDRHKLPYFTF